jgi:hypothetical protein
MVSTIAERRKVLQEKVLQEEERQKKDKNQLPWIQKYLELADLLIRRGKFRPPGGEQKPRV